MTLKLYSDNLSNRREKLNVELSHVEPCKIGQPPSSVLTKWRYTSGPSASIASSLTQEAYKRRTLRVELSSTVPFGGDDERSSEIMKK